MRFGRLQDQLHPHARYVLPDPDNAGAWLVLSHDEYSKRVCDQSRARSGIFELMAQPVTYHYIQHDGVFGGRKVMCKPVVLRSANASCLFSAIEAAIA
eukprot:11166767-Lingulodinium_polyedra.AAC.1